MSAIGSHSEVGDPLARRRELIDFRVFQAAMADLDRRFKP